jgi:hypothetical protein
MKQILHNHRSIGLALGVTSIATCGFFYHQHTKHKPLNNHLQQVMQDYGYSKTQQKALLDLLKTYQVNTTCTARNKQEANQWLIQTTQKHWLRKGERWSPENETLEQRLQADKSHFLTILEQLGRNQTMTPSPQDIKHHIAAIPGGTKPRVSMRFNAMIEKINQGTIPTKIIAVTGYRALLPEEAPEITENRTEAHMIKQTWYALVKDHPELAKIPFEISESKKPEGQARANTFDTVQKLAKRDDCQNGTLVVYIEQPFAPRFLSIFSAYMHIPVFIDTKAIDAKQNPLFLWPDEEARRIYMMSKLPLFQYENTATVPLPNPSP